jgi:hypothetical protein
MSVRPHWSRQATCHLVQVDAMFARKALGTITNCKTVEEFNQRHPVEVCDVPTIYRYTRDMLEGKWRLPIGDVLVRDNMIVFDEEGLCNGRHRMWAVILADQQVPGFSIPLWVKDD